MSEQGLSPLQEAEAQRLHPLSALFVAGGMLRKVALPVLGGLVLGRGHQGWELWATVPLCLIAMWSVLRTSRYRYQLKDGELLVQEGVLGREWRHIPLARIHTSNQRRQLLHRLLGVTELSLESAAGGKPEAVMRVLSLRAAVALEARLRHAPAPDAVAPAATETLASIGTETAVAPAVGHSSSAPRTWLQLGMGEIVRLGLASNRGMVIVGVLFGAVMQKDQLREPFLRAMRVPLVWLKQTSAGLLAQGHWGWWLLEAGVLLLVGLLVLNLLSIVLALFKYHGFHLEQQGEKLVQRRGLSTRVSASARLPRLQRWEMQQNLRHRLMGRCRLAVTVAGDGDQHEHGLAPGGRFEELAPIATPAEAQQMLQRCLPALDWAALQWRPLGTKTLWRQLWGQGRWLALILGAGVMINVALHWALPAIGLAGVALLAVLALFAYARAWTAFAAVAEQGELLLYRHGVLNRQWVLIAGPRLQHVALYSSALDRSLGLTHLRADTLGGSRQHRALDIPCLDLAAAQWLRERLWRQILRPY
ncbi:PH domain-containing protein [Paucibacter sp. APW11]|uniref:PH domain-containing protein n=1 Tax=Roseateles aquae TaxID=3077235 RepID=A0ABU3PC38_9BURK|nr:PH domain-containing protein [Paucibacter sp. APW11]MDT9000131.1 PH domain-containing protein [Paucibacter sp. APW11]